jgi:hypothetical protein
VPSAPLESVGATSGRSTPGTLLGQTHARSRLWLGITGVGTTVLGALTLLLQPDLASALAIRLSGWVGVSASELSLRAVVGTAVLLAALHALVLFPLDLLGGTVVVRTEQRVLSWLIDWMRGVVVTVLLIGAATATLFAGHQIAGRPGVVLAAIVMHVVWIALQGLLARLVGGWTPRAASPALVQAAQEAGLEPSRIREVDVDDPAAVGGWIGWGRSLWVPASWVAGMSSTALTAQLVRRRIARETGLRLRGLLGAMAWNMIGVAALVFAAALEPIVPSNVVLFMSGMTLWSFIGVLLLPTPSRRAVFAIDRDAARSVGADHVMTAVRFIDAQQDDEIERPRGIETVFHPVPSRGSREAAIVRANPRAPRGAYHLTRIMLGSSVVSLALLGRSVHCNIGRPSLWVIYPGE